VELENYQSDFFFPGMILTFIFMMIFILYILMMSRVLVVSAPVYFYVFMALILNCLLVGFAMFHVLCAYTTEKSQDLKKFWKSRLFQKQQIKELKALAPFGISVGPFFVYRRRTLCDVIGNVINYSLTMVFATR